MTFILSSPPVICPLPATEDRPVWSVMIPVYNCAHFLQETLVSVLMQGIPEQKMQIEVVDDASTDADVESLVAQIGKGRIKYFRQAHNVGSLRNFETCINRSKGRLIHLLHGDDRVKMGYYHKIEELFRQYPEAGASFCRYDSINEGGIKVSEKSREMKQDGILKNWLLSISERQRIQYAAITVRREVYEQLGGFYGIDYGEDWEMWVRIARYFPVAYTPEILAEYRKHSASISGKKQLEGDYLEDLLRAMMLIQDHLPEENKKQVLNKSKKYYASYAIMVANDLWHVFNDKELVKAQIEKALHLHQSPMLYWMIIKLYYTITFRRT